MRTLRVRIAASYVVLIVTAMVALGASLLVAETRRFRAELDNRLLAEARLVADAVAGPLSVHPGVEALDAIADRLGQEGGVRVTLIGVGGTVLGDSLEDPRVMENHGARPEFVEALATGSGRDTRASATDGIAYRYVAAPIRSGGVLIGVARVSMTEDAINAEQRRSALNVLGATAAAAFAAGVLAVIIAGAVTQPLDRLRVAAAAFASGKLDQHVPVSGPVETVDLALAFNEMVDRLRETVATVTEERSRWQALLAASADALVAIDHAGTVRYLNPAAEQLYGSAAGRPFFEVARNHELVALVHDAVRRHERVSAQVTPGAPGRWFQAIVSPTTVGDEQWTMVVLHDITDVRLADTVRRDFVANVSHELRTPLAAIKAVVETLRDGAINDPPAAEQFLNLVDEEVDRLVHLVEELLQLSRIESGKEMEFVDARPHDVLQSAVDRFVYTAERAGVTVTLDAPESLPVIHADVARLGQATGNLIHNAIKFTPPGGHVEVSARQQNGHLRIAVSDTGAGINPDDLPRIFERFYVGDRARSGRGTGLGLAIVKHVALAHGGSVDARSTLGRGSTFTIDIPIAPHSKG